MIPTARNRMAMAVLGISRPCWNAIMGIWIWRLLPTMREKGLWTARTACLRFGKRETMYSGCRALIFGQARGVWMALSLIGTRFAKRPTEMAGQFSPTTDFVFFKMG